MTIKTIKFATALAASLLCCSLLMAGPVAAVPIELEGPISDIVDNGDGTGSITVMDIVVQIPAGTPINTPTRTITITQLADPTSLPGRLEAGFIGGTAIILGDSDGVTHIANDVFTEPAENVVLGLITDSNCAAAGNPRLCSNNSIEALGTPTRRLTNGNTARRMPAIHPFNESGFQIHLGNTELAGELLGAPVGFEGYFDGVQLNWFVLEFGGLGQLRRPTRSEVSVTRAQCRERADRGIELDVMGAVHRAGTAFPNQTFPDPTVGANGTTATRIRVRVPGGEIFPGINGDGDPIDQVTAALDEITGLPTGIGDYDYQLSEQPGFTVCPDRVRVTFIIQGEANANITADVDVR